MRKYPKTYHVEGSDGRPAGGKDVVSFADLDCDVLVAELKLDGSHFGLEFEGAQWNLWHRNSVVRSQPEYHLLKDWRARSNLQYWIGNRYEVHGEWLYARHTIAYDSLPCYAFHTDVYDKVTESWMSTPARTELLSDMPDKSFQPIPVLGRWGPEEYKAPGFVDTLKALTETKMFTDEPAEGLFLKAEVCEETVGFYKFIRPGFIQRVVSQVHWNNRPLIPNLTRSESAE